MATKSSYLKQRLFNHYLSKVLSYLVIMIILLILFFFLVLPVYTIISKAFFGPKGFTLEYFALLFSNKLHIEAILNSLKIGSLTTILCAFISLPLAFINTRLDFKGKTILSGLLLVPMIMPPFVGAIGIQRFFARFGSINIFLMDKGIITSPIDWLSSENTLLAVVILEALHLYPIMYLNISAALANLDPSLEEIGNTLGISSFAKFKDIIFPLILPGFFSGSIIVFIWALTDLGTPLLVGFHTTMPVYIFNMVTDINENPMGFALVFFVILFTVSFFLLSKIKISKVKYEMLGKGHTTSVVRKASKVNLVFIYPMILSIIFLALIPHITVLITSLSNNWFMTPLPEELTLNHFYMVFHQELSSIAIKNSLVFSLLSTLIDIILGISIAYIIARKIVPFPNLLDALVMTPLALPGIVLAFGYVVTYNNTPLDPLNNPIPLLIIAYSIRRLPYMVRAASAGLQQTSRSLEEASESFGASKLKTITKITLPLVLANVIAGGLLCFSYAMLDVSDSLILAMKDNFYPLTKAIYSLYLEQGSGEFVASALGVISMLILSVCIIGASSVLGKKMGELFRG